MHGKCSFEESSFVAKFMMILILCYAIGTAKSQAVYLVCSYFGICELILPDRKLGEFSLNRTLKAIGQKIILRMEISMENSTPAFCSSSETEIDNSVWQHLLISAEFERANESFLESCLSCLLRNPKWVLVKNVLYLYLAAINNGSWKFSTFSGVKFQLFTSQKVKINYSLHLDFQFSCTITLYRLCCRESASAASLSSSIATYITSLLWLGLYCTFSSPSAMELCLGPLVVWWMFS